MKIDLDDVLFWMDAIRESEDRYRTLESFWKGQIRSKIWLVNTLEEINFHNTNTIVIHGGWYGVLASLLFNSKINIKNIISIDIDPKCEKIAYTMNKRYEVDGRFKAITTDMCDYKYDANIVINTSCEHITQSQYDKWLNNVPKDALIILQSNNFFNCDEHIRCSKDLNDFIEISKIDPSWTGELKLPSYKRWMIVGKKCIN